MCDNALIVWLPVFSGGKHHRRIGCCRGKTRNKRECLLDCQIHGSRRLAATLYQRLLTTLNLQVLSLEARVTIMMTMATPGLFNHNYNALLRVEQNILQLVLVPTLPALLTRFLFAALSRLLTGLLPRITGRWSTTTASSHLG